jgi:hypothetical protein
MWLAFMLNERSDKSHANLEAKEPAQATPYQEQAAAAPASSQEALEAAVNCRW